MVLEPHELRAADHGVQDFTEAFARFPCLVDVRMNHGWSLYSGGWGLSGAERENPFAAAFANAGADHLHGHPSGVYQLSSQTERQLRCLHAGDASWKFLKQDEATMQKSKDILKSLRDLALVVSLGYAEDAIGVEIPECEAWVYENDIHTNKLYDLLTSGPELTHLDLTFDRREPYAPIKSTTFSRPLTGRSFTVCALRTSTQQLKTGLPPLSDTGQRSNVSLSVL